MAVGKGVAVGWTVGAGVGVGVGVGKGVAGGVGSGVGIKVGLATNSGGVAGVAMGTEGKGVGVVAEPGAGRSGGVGGPGCAAKGEFGLPESPPGTLAPGTLDSKTPVFCDGSVSRISTAAGAGMEAGTSRGEPTELGKPGVGAAAGRQLATATAAIRAAHRPKIRMLLRPMPNRRNTAAEAPTAKAGNPS